MAKHTTEISEARVGDNPTGVGVMPTFSLDQWENVGRPGAQEHKPGGQGESPEPFAKPGAQEATGPSAGSAERFARPGGPEGWM